MAKSLIDQEQSQSLQALRQEVAEIRALAEHPPGLYAACCRDYKILATTLLLGGGLLLLAAGGLLAIIGVISLADLKEFFGIAKSSIPVLPTE